MHGSVWVIVPTIDERRNLAILLPQLLNLDPDWRLLVVDDGSVDGTRKFLQKKGKGEPRLSAIYRDRRGFGSALREGMAYALERGATRIVTMDGDLSHDPRDIPRLLAVLADLVIGSRWLAESGSVGWTRGQRFISYAANRLARFSLGAPERDLTNGFRAYGQSMAELVVAESTADGFHFEVEAANVAKKHGMSITEIPITFHERVWGEAKRATGREAASLVRFLTTRSPLRLFLVVGLLAALVNEFMLIALAGVYAIHYLIAGVVAIAAGVLTAFTLNEVWTYRGRLPKGRWLRLARYSGFVSGGLLLNLLILWALTDFAGLQYSLSNIFGMGTALSWNYVLLNVVRRPF